MKENVIRTVCVKLDINGHNATLTDTMKMFNAAASWIAQTCWDENITNTNTAHHRVYGETRNRFGLLAQLAIHARVKAMEAIASVKKKKDASCPQFGPCGSVRMDNHHSYTFKPLDQVSILTAQGRVLCKMVMGERQRTMLTDTEWENGTADLVWRQGVYYLHVTQSKEKPEEQEHNDVIGVDLGIVNIATDSDGAQFTGEQVRTVRARYKRQREELQKVNTPSAKRKLKKKSGKEHRFQSDVNHCISKALVTKAAVSRKALALEDLTGIRERITVRREQRYERHSWAFFQLRQFISYKADREGIAVILVDPAYTSQTCHMCGHCEKANRRTQSEFSCQRCGFTMNADANAAINIKTVAVNQPMVSPLGRCVVRVDTSPLL